MISHFPKNFSITTICGRTEGEDERVEEAKEAEEVYFIFVFLYALVLYFACLFYFVIVLRHLTKALVPVNSKSTSFTHLGLLFLVFFSNVNYLSRWWFQLTATALPSPGTL